MARTRGYRLRAPAPGGPLTVAAFGPGAVRVAARHADRMVLNLLTPASTARLVTAMRDAVPPDRPVPRVASWVTAAVDPDEAALAQLRRGVVGYLAAPGYGEVFAEAGFGDLVAYARTRPKPADLLTAVPDELVACVGVVGSAAAVQARIAECGEAGVDEVCLVPVSTDQDPAGRTTLETLSS